jgi:putative ABC transport system permease protein
MRLGWILHALISHWRRRPFQLLTLIGGLAVATALWSGVQALNVQARLSYDRAAEQLIGDGMRALVASDATHVTQADYVALRRAGWPVTPVLEGEAMIGDHSIRIVGVDPVTAPRDGGVLSALGAIADEGDADVGLVDMIVPPHLALIAPQTLAQLDRTATAILPPMRVSAAVPPDTVLTDMAAAMALVEPVTDGAFTRLLVSGDITERIGGLEGLTEGRLRLVEPTDGNDLARLTDSFHLNLTAFGFLSFLVGLFIVNAATGLAFEQRRPMLRTLRACGASSRALSAVLIAELVALALIAGLIGIASGYLVASALLPDVAASLRGLYGAQVDGELSLSPAWWLSGMAMSVVGAILAGGAGLWRAHRLPVLAPAQPQAWLGALEKGLAMQATGAAILLSCAGALLVFGGGLVAGFALMGALLLGAALLLPVVLAAILKAAEQLNMAARPLTQWFFADTRQQLPGLSLALMALLLALSVNIGVSTMVDSFRQTFTGWLDQRLTAELYVGGRTNDEGADIAAFLAEDPVVSAVLPVWESQTRFDGFPVEVYGFRDDATYRDHWPILQEQSDAWDAAAAGTAVLVNEQMARRFALTPGSRVALDTQTGIWDVAVAAVYSDYGNPRGQVMIAVEQLVARFPAAEKRRFAVRAAPDDVPALMQRLRDRFALDASRLVDQAALKNVSSRIFERTFAVTVALNALTLGVAGVALLASLLTLSSTRLVQLAPLWAMGVTRGQLAAIELLRALALALMTALLAVPLGLAVAWVLMNVVNVEAFGWQLPLYLFPAQWLQLVLMALATAFLAALLPVARLRATTPATLAKVFADER